jgi:hypothetical protein
MRELMAYVLFQSAGIAINFGVYSILIERSAIFYVHYLSLPAAPGTGRGG